MQHHIFPEEFKMRSIETVVIRDPRFLNHLNRSAIGGVPVFDMTDPDWRIDYVQDDCKPVFLGGRGVRS